MWRLGLDLCGPFRESVTGNRYVAIAIDSFSKYVEGKGNNFPFCQGYKVLRILRA